MLKHFFVIISFFFASYSFSQATSNDFPQDWEGKWAGELQIFNHAGLAHQLPMELHILPTKDSLKTSWTWTIVYGSGEDADNRQYELLAIDSAQGKYLIDEKNSIKIEGFLIDNQFHQWFEVGGSTLLTTTSKSEDTLVWEIIVSQNTPISKTGDGIHQGEEIPLVSTYPVTGLQRAVLTRKE